MGYEGSNLNILTFTLVCTVLRDSLPRNTQGHIPPVSFKNFPFLGCYYSLKAIFVLEESRLSLALKAMVLCSLPFFHSKSFKLQFSDGFYLMFEVFV